MSIGPGPSVAPTLLRVAASVALFTVGVSGCGFRHLARTVGAGRTEARASLGGPMLSNLGVAMPLPNVHVSLRHGLTDDVDIDGGLSLLGLAYGVVALDLAGVVQLYEESDFAISASGRGHFWLGLRGPDARFFPELGVHLEGRAHELLTVCGGLIALAQFGPPRDKPPVFMAPYAGVEFLASRELGLMAELAWISPFEDSTSVVSWEPAQLGAVVVQLGARLRFGGE